MDNKAPTAVVKFLSFMTAKWFAAERAHWKAIDGKEYSDEELALGWFHTHNKFFE